MNKFALTLCALIPACIGLAQTRPATPDFSGLWKCNMEKSNFGTSPAPPDLSIRIVQDKTKLVLTQIVGGSEEQFMLPLDGSEGVNQLAPGTMRSKTKWEKDALVVESVLGTETKMRDVLTLNADGRAIKHTRRISSPRGDSDWQLLFEKVESKPDFSGTWKANVAKSNFGSFPAPTAMTVKIDHKEPSLKMTTNISSEQGDFDFEANYKTDGTEVSNTFGPMSMKAKSRWDGSALLVDAKGEGGDFSSKEKWTLSADGKTLTVVREFSGQQGEMKQTVVHDKQ